MANFSNFGLLIFVQWQQQKYSFFMCPPEVQLRQF